MDHGVSDSAWEESVNGQKASIARTHGVSSRFGTYIVANVQSHLIMGKLTGTRHGDAANDLLAYYGEKVTELERLANTSWRPSL